MSPRTAVVKHFEYIACSLLSFRFADFNKLERCFPEEHFSRFRAVSFIEWRVAPCCFGAARSSLLTCGGGRDHSDAGFRIERVCEDLFFI